MGTTETTDKTTDERADEGGTDASSVSLCRNLSVVVEKFVIQQVLRAKRKTQHRGLVFFTSI